MSKIQHAPSLSYDDPLYEFFFTNYSPQAWFSREHSVEEVDLRQIPLSEWPEHEMTAVTLPQSLRDYLEKDPDHEFPEAETEAVELAVEKFHNVQLPYGILFKPGHGDFPTCCLLVSQWAEGCW